MRRRCIPTCSGCAQARRFPDDRFTRRTHQIVTEDQDHFESLLLASKKAQAEILGRIRAEPSCEEAEARRAVAGGGE